MLSPERYNARGWETEPPIINNRVFLWSGKTDNGKFMYVDTANYGVSSVEQLGVDMGILKQEVEFKTATQTQLFDYCQTDVEILEKFILEYLHYLRDKNLGSYGLTFASQALITFRHKFNHSSIHIHNNQSAIALERGAYYGGRVECYKIGIYNGAEYFYVDINSMYPTIMQNSPVPTKLRGYTEDIPLAYLKTRL